MKEREDIRYDLSDFHKKDDKIISDFKYISRQIEFRKSFFIRYEGANFEVYHPLLALFFSQTQITLNEQLNKQNTKAIITYDYFESFMQGYNKGTEYFKKNYKATPELIYGKNAELYVKDIHSMFFHEGCQSPTQGWISFVKSFTMTLSHSIIKNYGFYSGIVREVQKTIAKHPKLFREFDNCENEPSKLKAPESIKAIYKEKDSVKQFLNDWMDGIDSDLEIHNRLDKLTSNFDSLKVELLKVDIDKLIEEMELLCKADPLYREQMEKPIVAGCPSKMDLANALRKHISVMIHSDETEQKPVNFLNNFDNIQPIEVYKFFKSNLVEKGYLGDQELNKYLKTAFELQAIPEPLFKLKQTPRKQTIYTIFYTYYKDIAGKKHDQQTRYVELLGNYFEGYNSDIIKTNWAREYKVKR
jgi:RNA binding exosome subunit